MNKLMQPIYNLVGRLLFSQQQVWEQKKNAKTMSLTVVFSLVWGWRWQK